jgi:hypothetical protein
MKVKRLELKDFDVQITMTNHEAKSVYELLRVIPIEVHNGLAMRHDDYRERHVVDLRSKLLDVVYNMGRATLER